MRGNLDGEKTEFSCGVTKISIKGDKTTNIFDIFHTN